LEQPHQLSPSTAETSDLAGRPAISWRGHTCTGPATPQEPSALPRSAGTPCRLERRDRAPASGQAQVRPCAHPGDYPTRACEPKVALDALEHPAQAGV
jgi:hypothetical protein